MKKLRPNPISIEPPGPGAGEPQEPKQRFELPWDLTSWAERPMLLRWITEEVETLDWQNSELVEFLRANPSFQARALLILITYAYALGACESDDVVTLSYQEPALKTLLSSHHPSATAVSRFRREHRGLLKWSLVQCFKRALRHHYEMGDTPIPPGLRRALGEAATNRLDLARHMDRSVQAE